MEIDRFKVKGDPSRSKTMKDICWAAYHEPPPDLSRAWKQSTTTTLRFHLPFGSYLCVVDIDKTTGEVKVRRFYALDDCGTRINPMIIEGQNPRRPHGRLCRRARPANAVRRSGQPAGHTLMDYFLPTAVETPNGRRISR